MSSSTPFFCWLLRIDVSVITILWICGRPKNHTISVGMVVNTFCKSKDWHNLTRDGPIRCLEPNFQSPDPYKQGPKSPLRSLPENPKTIKIDIAHTYAIAGFGKEDLASSIIFLAVRCAVWGAMGYEDQLELAWQDFKGWCTRNKKHTTILEFSKRELKITSWLVCYGNFF